VTAKERHREEVFRAAGWHPECALGALRRFGPCDGELEADHIIEVRRLTAVHAERRLQSRPLPCLVCGGTGKVADLATFASAEPTPLPCHVCDGTGEATTDSLIADGRNGWPLCDGVHHPRKTRALIEIPREVLPASVEAFAADYDIVHLLDRYFR
jgi:hypothetical protein